MVEFNSFTGRILLGQHASEDDRYDDDVEDLFSPVVFDAERFDIVLYSGMGGYYSIEDDHIQTVDGEQVYFPYENEANAEVAVGGLPDDIDFTEKATDVQIQYAEVDGEVYLRSQNEITAYGGQHLVIDGNLYRIHDSLLVVRDETTDTDEFLDIPAVEEPVLVENVETGHARPLEYDRVAELVENDEPNGALKLQEPDSVIAELF